METKNLPYETEQAILGAIAAVALAGIAAAKLAALQEAMMLGMPVPLSSSCLDSAEYNARTSTMTLAFEDGSSHTYSADPGTFARLCTAASPGSFFNAHIR